MRLRTTFTAGLHAPSGLWARLHAPSGLWAVAGVLAVTACSKQQHDDPDVAAGYRDNNKYEADIVTAEKRKNYKDQGEGIKPETLQSIQETIDNVYAKDFENCLEDQMGEQGTRFMRSVFLVEFTIEKSGRATQARVLEIETRKQDARGSDLGAVDSAGMKDCIQTSIKEWEFDPPPEVNYVHTHKGQVGEAF
jgi:hypothetical protein